MKHDEIIRWHSAAEEKPMPLRPERPPGTPGYKDYEWYNWVLVKFTEGDEGDGGGINFAHWSPYGSGQWEGDEGNDWPPDAVAYWAELPTGPGAP